jgi:hypothetical protein
MKLANSLLAVRQWLETSEDILDLDPLSFDERIAQLHALNKSKDVKGIVQLLYKHLPMPDALDQYDYDQAIAAMRDLGFFIGILKRHGIEPVEAVPELEYVLLVLMVKTNLPPRDTLIHYTVWNPRGKRMRTYTGLEDEVCLIESVKMAYPSLMEAIAILNAMHETDLCGHDFEEKCLFVRDLMVGMVKGVVHAKKNVSPSVFANELRFYFDPIKVDYNREYIGPGAVEMPMFVFDHLLWSCDCREQAYTDFKEGYLAYNLPIIREIYRRYDFMPSLVTRVATNLQQDPSPARLSAAKTVLELCTVLKSFRMPHKKMAEEAYAQGEDHHRDHGSGGYSVNILHQILTLQNNKFAVLQEEINAVHSKATVG